MMTDPIADMLTRIRNAQMVLKNEVRMPYSKMKERIAEILASEGYLVAVKKEEAGSRQELVLELKYVEKQPAITMLERVSKPGRRVYVDVKNMPYVYDGLGISIISTSKGLMTNKQAVSNKIGGEVICQVF